MRRTSYVYLTIVLDILLGKLVGIIVHARSIPYFFLKNNSYITGVITCSALPAFPRLSCNKIHSQEKAIELMKGFEERHLKTVWLSAFLSTSCLKNGNNGWGFSSHQGPQNYSISGAWV